MRPRHGRFDPDRTEDATRHTARSATPGSGAASVAASLTDREMSLLVDGKRNQDISRELAISERTVKFHVSGLFVKLGVSSRTQAVALALKQGLLGP